MLKKIIVSCLLVVGVAACSEPTRIALKPDLTPKPSAIGRYKTVDLQVIDTRQKPASSDVEVINDDQAAALIYAQIKRGLEEKGFKIDDAKTARDLIIEIEKLHYSSDGRGFIGDMQVDVKLKALAAESRDDFIESYYGVKRTDQNIRERSETAQEEYVNRYINETLAQIFNDLELMMFLAGKTPEPTYKPN